MVRSSKLFVNSTHKTKTWWILVSVLVFVFVPFLILFLLCGEINLLDLNWIVAQNKSVWHGYVTDGNIEVLTRKYWMFYDGGWQPLYQALLQAKNAGQAISINSYKTFFNPVVLAPLFGLLAWSFAYPIIFNATKVSGLDILPFSFTGGFMCFTIIITGLIPVWSNVVVCWIIRFIIAFVVGLSVFFATNAGTNKFLSTRNYGYDIVFGYKSLDKDTEKVKEELKTHIDIFKNEDKTYIDLPKEEK